MKKIPLFLIFALIALTGSAQWRWLNPLPQGNFLSDITFTTPTNGYAVGYSGVLVTTEDSGNSWNYSGNIGFNDIESIFFHNPDTGWICGYGIVAKSCDAGVTWIPTSVPNQNDTYNDIYFINSTKGFMSGDYGELFYSTDGGDSWTMITSGTEENLHEIFFVTDQVGYIAADNGYVIKTTNGGTSWTPIDLNTTSGVQQMSFINENVGFLATSGTGVMRTTNGGASWDFTLIGDYDYLYGIYALNQNSIIAISESGGIWNSSNGGVTFTNLQTFSNEYFQYSTISFADDEVGCISGDDGFLMRTANKGLTWDLVTLPVVTSYKRVKFFDAQLGWLVGSGGKAMKTVDGGLTWTDRSTGSFYGLIDIFIGDPTHLWSVATIGRIYKSTDGNSWVEVTTPTTQNLNKVAFYDLLNGMAVGYNGVILKTTDGGDNWTLLSSGVTSIINTIIYLSSDTLIAGTVNGKILRTVNNGQTWSTISLPVNREVRSIIKTDSDTIYVFTNVGQSIISTDKGLTWTLQKRFTACNLREVTRTPSGDLYVCGSNGMIMTTAQSNVGITEFLNSTYQTLLLFPNPTTDIIHYPLKIQDKITYQIYDLQGRLVQAGFVEGNSMKINQLPTGTYIVHSKVDQKQYVSKIVKN